MDTAADLDVGLIGAKSVETSAQVDTSTPCQILDSRIQQGEVATIYLWRLQATWTEELGGLG